MRLKRSKCIILPLALKKKLYDMIASGIKHEEYRTSSSVCRMIERKSGEWLMECCRKRLVVKFYLGYKTNLPSKAYLVDGVFYTDYCKHPEWGEPEGKHCVIELGEQVTFVE